MTMKKFRLIYTLLAVAMLSTACEDEPVSKVTPAADGSEIIFGGRAGFENSNPESRTIYSGETYTYNNVTYERIDWIEGDKIEIYCPEANNGPSAHYNITGFKANDENAGNTNKGSDYAYLTRIEDTALQWNGNGVHNFYAMYTGERSNGVLLAEKFRSMGYDIPDERIINVGAAIGSHVGPNACGMVYIAE